MTQREIQPTQDIVEAINTIGLNKAIVLAKELLDAKREMLRFKGETSNKFYKDPNVIWYSGYLVGYALGHFDAAQIAADVESPSDTTE